MLNEHHQTATCLSSTVRRRPVDHGAHHQEGAAAGARLSARPPARSAALRGRAFDDRRDLRRPPRHGLRQGRAVRISGVEPEPGRRDGSLVGGARLHPQGDEPPRRAVQLGGRALPLPAGQHLAAPDPAAAPAAVEHDQQQEQRVCARRERLRDRDARLGLRHAPALRRLPAGLLQDAPQGAGRRPLRLSRTGGGRPQRSRGAPPRRPDRRLSAHLGDRSHSVSQSAGLPLGRGQRENPEGLQAAARHRQGRPPGRHLHMQRAGPDRRRHYVLRHARSGLRADRRVLRILRRHGQPADDGPGRLSQPRGHGRQPDAVRERSDAAAARRGSSRWPRSQRLSTR